MRALRVVILGSGLIGTDLLFKAIASPSLRPIALLGRDAASKGLDAARKLGIATSADGIGYLEDNPSCCDLVFDATSAAGHAAHAPVLERLGITAVDLTPAGVGAMCVPAVNLGECAGRRNLNMVTCGGQAAVPILHAIRAAQPEIEYIEVVSSIAARSAGPATRANLDEYVHTTERAALHFSGCGRAKAILNINPAEPCVHMQTTVLAKVARPDMARIGPAVEAAAAAIRRYVPGYAIVVPPTYDHGRVAVMARVTGLGHHLPPFAGNLDIITCAAVAAAEAHAARRSFAAAGEVTA